MPSVADRLEEIRRAIEQLRSAADHDDDLQRLRSAEELERQFEDIVNSEELHAAARDGLCLYSGGMGGFQDAGTPAVATAIARLSEALRHAI
jgi:hypothetical protein